MIETIFRRPADGRSLPFHLCALLVVFVIKGVALVHWGQIYGRLSVPPVYDDVTYFTDAVERLQIFLDHGLAAVIADLINRPPHAPYSTIASMIAFFIGGPNPAGPYIMNAITLALLTVMLLRLFRVDAIATCCIALVIVATPWFDTTVTMFHPDLVSGYAAAIIAAVLVWQNEIVRTPAHAAVLGATAGVILLIKPVAFAMVIGIWGLAFLIGAATAYREDKSLSRIAMRLGIGLIPAVIIAGPYFAREIIGIFKYIYLGFVTEREAWSHRVAPSEHSFYYLTQARSLLQFWLPVASVGALAIFLAGAISRERLTSLRFAGLMLVAVVAYLVPASLEVKHPYYGGVLYGCVVVGLILVIHHLLDRLYFRDSFGQLQRPRFAAFGNRPIVGAAGAMIILVAAANLSDFQPRWGFKIGRASLTEFNNVYDFLKEFSGSEAAVTPPTLVVYFPSPIPISPHVYRFRGLVDNLLVNPLMSPHETDLQKVIDAARQASVVVVPDEDTLKTTYYPFAVAKLMPAFREWLAQDNRFKHARTVHTVVGAIDIYAVPH